MCEMVVMTSSLQIHCRHSQNFGKYDIYKMICYFNSFVGKTTILFFFFNVGKP